MKVVFTLDELMNLNKKALIRLAKFYSVKIEKGATSEEIAHAIHNINVLENEDDLIMSFPDSVDPMSLPSERRMSVRVARCQKKNE